MVAFSEEVLLLELPIEKLGRIIRIRVKHDWDCVTAITGYEGSSKSTCSIHLAKYTDKTFELDKRMIWTANEEKVKSLISELPKYSCIVADEAIKLLHKQNWQTKLQKFLNMLFTVARDENKIVFLLMPRFTDFNEYFRNHRIFLWIHVVERGIAVVFKKEWSPFATDPWNVGYNSKILMDLPKRKEAMDLNQKLKVLSRCKGFLCWFRYDDLDKDTKKLYKKLKNRNKYEMQYEEKSEDLKKEKINSAIRIVRLIDAYAEKMNQKPNNICKDIANISPSTYKKYKEISEKYDKDGAIIVDRENKEYWDELKEKEILQKEDNDESEDSL